VFAYHEHTHELLEQQAVDLAAERFADLVAAGHIIEGPGAPLTELYFARFENVRAAREFLTAVHAEALHFGVQPAEPYIIFDGERTMSHSIAEDTNPGGYLIFAGEPVFVPNVKIHNFLETGMRFEEPKGVHPRPTDAEVDKITLHWTASERVGQKGAEDVLRNMKARKDAGCHLFVENGGEVWQFADLVTEMTTHVSHKVVKPSSIGIEVSDYGWLKNHAKAPTAGKDRPKYETTIHGWRTTYADYYLPQKEAVLAVCTAICEQLGIPKQVMRAPWRVRGNKELRAFQGVHGHLHCALGKNPKTDPGTSPLNFIASAWGLG
jgi:N-acetyl-anhydromuramyl-L-alanine amidase AmpD